MIGKAKFSLGKGKTQTLRVHLNAKGRMLLHKAGKPGLKVTVEGSGIESRTLALEASKRVAKHKHHAKGKHHTKKR